MKITTVYGFSQDEIETLTAAGKILGEVANTYNEPSEDAKVLDETTVSLVKALKDVLARLDG